MISTEQLTELIALLSPREKTMFEQSISKNKKQHQIFRTLLSSPSSRYLQTDKNFHKYKSELKTKLIDFLLIEDSDTSAPDMVVRKQIDTARVLLNRRQLKSAEDMLTNAVKVAAHIELHHVVIEALQVQVSIVRKTYGLSSTDKLEELYRQIQHVLELIRSETNYVFEYDKAVKAVNGQHSHNLTFTNLPENAPTRTALRYVYALKALQAHSLKNKEDCQKYRRLIVELWEEYPEWKMMYPTAYLSALSNYASALSPQENQSQFAELIDRIFLFASSESLPSYTAFQLGRYLQSYFLLNTGQFHELAQLEFETNRKLSPMSGKLNLDFELAIAYNIIQALWLTALPDNAQNWINRIHKTQGLQIRSDIRNFACLMEVVLKYENNERLSQKRLISGLITKSKLESLDPIFSRCIDYIIRLKHLPFPDRPQILMELDTFLDKEFKGQTGFEALKIFTHHQLHNTPKAQLASKFFG